jgi:hypothetical protein
VTLIDVLKCQILGEVEYAQHNFARLRPILYSTDGRAWTGTVDRAWFPQAGLVFSLATELRFAQAGSMWTFQVRPNERESGAEHGKDAFMTVQIKPATRFLTELEPISGESLRLFATVDGFDPKSSHGGVILPEAEDRWILANEFERGPDGLARVTNARALGHMRVLEGTLEELAGCATPDGRWLLPVMYSGHGSDIRNWLPPKALAEQIANELRRWMPHAPHKTKAAAAASALRDLAPVLDTISATRSIEVRAALDRITALSMDAEALTGSVDQLVEALLASPAIASTIAEEKEAIRRDLESQALESAEMLEAEARARLATEQAEMHEALAQDQAKLEAIRLEIATGESQIEDLRRRQRSETAAFTRSLEGLIARARKEPAAYAAEWLAKLGVREFTSTGEQADARIEPSDLQDHAQISEEDLGRMLMRESPIRNNGTPRFLLMDAAIRARELVVGIGPRARQVIESWLAGFAPNWAVARASDPSLLAFDDLLPTGPRGAVAPLAYAIALARATPERSIVALLDDVDPAAGSFWLPQAARAGRRPAAHGLPKNLFMVALVEGDAASLALCPTRVGELFPLSFEDAEEVGKGELISDPREIPLALFATPLLSNGLNERVAALIGTAKNTFTSEDVSRIGDEFAAFLQWSKHGADKPGDMMEIAKVLSNAAAKTRKGEE